MKNIWDFFFTFLLNFENWTIQTKVEIQHIYTLFTKRKKKYCILRKFEIIAVDSLYDIEVLTQLIVCMILKL